MLGDPYKIVRRLDEEFMKANTALPTMRMRDLFSMRMSDDKDPIQFFSQYKKRVNELIATGGTVSKENKLEHCAIVEVLKFTLFSFFFKLLKWMKIN